MIKKNISSLIISGVMAVLLSLLLNRYSTLVSNGWVYSLVYFILVSLIFNLVYAYQARKNSFVQVMLVGIVVKLLLALIVILICSVRYKPHFLSFSAHFIGHYILFTVFEIRYLLYLIKTNPIHPQ